MSRPAKSKSAKCWAVIPAAGSGQRMGADVAKQYLCIAGKPVIRWSIQPFLDEQRVCGMAVVLAAGDSQWSNCAPRAGDKLFLTAHGGSSRSVSVRNGLRALAPYARASDWVLIHDAARPCLNSGDLDCLIGRLWDDEVGGLLALRVRDTLKRESGEDRVVATTLDRSGVWLAQTPQMFRYAALCEALDRAIDKNFAVSDEASAMEMAGYAPRLVEARPHNFKITYPDDISIAEQILSARK